jgi:hypothetical protein
MMNLNKIFQVYLKVYPISKLSMKMKLLINCNVILCSDSGVSGVMLLTGGGDARGFCGIPYNMVIRLVCSQWSLGE